MSNNTPTMELQPLLSSSMQQRINGQAENMFNSAARKSSFDFVNVFDRSERFDCKLKNSLELLSSNVIITQKPTMTNKDILKYNDEEKNRIEIHGVVPIEIGEVMSDSEQQFNQNKSQLSNEAQSHFFSADVHQNTDTYMPNNYLTKQLQQILKQKEIPIQYVKGLLLVKDSSDIKSARRLKVERYLQKRRKKTWNRKICYNCRQKVAEQRLRIKGKFIKKRKAMQLLGLHKPVPLAQLKRLLEEKLHDKSHAEIQQLIRRT